MAEEQLSKKELRAQKHAQKAQRKAEEAQKQKRESFIQNIFLWGFIALLGAGLVLFVGNILTSSPDNIATTFDMPVAENDWIQGNPDAPVTIIEYADFQCPHCRDAVPMIDSLLKEYGDKLRVVYRYFPLSMFANSMPAARAAEAAGAQGKFFEMHDLLFDKQEVWAGVSDSESIFMDYAKELGLDMDAFKAAYASDATEKRILENRDEGVKFGVTGTPTFFVNGKLAKSSGAGLKEAIDAELVAEQDNASGVESTDSASEGATDAGNNAQE